MKLESYAEDLDKHAGGSPYYLEEACFYVQRAGTPEFNKQIEEIKNELYGFAPKVIDNNKITAFWLAEYGVTGWDGVINEDEELEFSRSNARSVFLNPAYYMSLNALLLTHSSNYSNYLFDEVNGDIEAAKKNCPTD